MKKLVSVLFLSLSLSFLFISSKAFAVFDLELREGTWTYTRFLEDNFLGTWGVYWRVETKATASPGSGNDQITIYNYKTKQLSSWGTTDDIVHRGHTMLIDQYNDKTYTYDTYCDILYVERNLTINKTVGWDSKNSPWINYPLTNGICYGSTYINVNHLYYNGEI